MNKTAHIVLGAPAEGALFPEPSMEDIVIGVDRGAMECLSRDIPMTIALGDFDSISEKEKDILNHKVKELNIFNSDKDDTDAELALVTAMEKFDVDKYVMYNWSGGRIDHLLNLLFLMYQERFEAIIDKLTFVNHTNTINYFRPGSYTIKKENDKSYIAFVGMTPVKDLHLSDLKYPLDYKSYDFPVTLVSNEIKNESCSFSFTEGIIAVIQSADS